MRSVPSLVVAFLLAGCAHPSAAPARGIRALSGVDPASRVLVRYAPEDEQVAARVRRALQHALPAAEQWGALPSRITVTIHPDHEALEAAARRPGRSWLRAWARRDAIELETIRSWSRGGATDDELVQLLTHELTHCALSEALGGDARRARAVPLWFWEGLATTAAGERFTFVQPVNAGGPALRAALHDAESPLAYAAAHHAFRSLLQRCGEDRIRELLARVRDGVEFPDAFREVIGIPVEAFERGLERSTQPG